MTIKTHATIDDLYAPEGIAEIVRGEVVRMSSTGEAPGYAADEIFVALHTYARQKGTGRSVGDNICLSFD